MKKLSIAIFCTLALLWGCKDDKSTVAPTSITLSYTTIDMIALDTATIYGVVNPLGSFPPISWSSSNTSVATISENGLITALGSGTTTITASIEGVDGVCRVTVSPTTFVVGSQNLTGGGSEAMVWRNGSPLYTLGVNDYYSYGNAIAIDSTKILSAGSTSDSLGMGATLWQDSLVLESFNSTTQGNYSSGIAIDGGEYYICGTILSSPSSGVYWKGNSQTLLNEGSGDCGANGIFVYNGVVYVVGYCQSDDYINMATLWIDGKATILADTSLYSNGAAVFVQNGDVYVAGSYNGGAAMWKNGTLTQLNYSGSGSSAEAIYVEGGNVYCAGYGTNDNGERFPVYWKNGAMAYQYPQSGIYNAIYLLNSKVYLAGTIYGEGVEVATQWTDTTSTSLGLTTQSSSANGIIVR